MTEMPNVEPGTILVIKADGSEFLHIAKAPEPRTQQLRELIGAETLDFVNLTWFNRLQPDLLMAVDDAGWEFEVINHGDGHIENRPTKPRKPINEQATAIYLLTCKPGTTHQIVGDVAIFHDLD